jgi:hypothetical protein
MEKSSAKERDIGTALAVEAAHQNTFTQDVAVDRFQDIGARGVRPQVELRIQRE